MRILIVGTVPPPGGDAAATLAEIATKFLAEGHDVELLSPDDRSAAHRSARLEGPLFALRLAWLSRRFEAVVLHFEEGLPLGPRAGRLWRAVTLTALAAALRMFRETTVRFDAASPIPGGIGSRAMGEIWSSVSHVVVGNEKNRDQLVSLWSLPEERVTVEPGRPVARTTLPAGLVGRRRRGPADGGARPRPGPGGARPCRDGRPDRARRCHRTGAGGPVRGRCQAHDRPRERRARCHRFGAAPRAEDRGD